MRGSGQAIFPGAAQIEEEFRKRSGGGKSFSCVGNTFVNANDLAHPPINAQLITHKHLLKSLLFARQSSFSPVISDVLNAINLELTTFRQQLPLHTKRHLIFSFIITIHRNINLSPYPLFFFLKIGNTVLSSKRESKMKGRK